MKFQHVFRESVLKFHFSTPDSVFVKSYRDFNIMFVQSQNSNLLKIKDSEYLLPDNVFVKIYRGGLKNSKTIFFQVQDITA
jgi:hypothetical protein